MQTVVLPAEALHVLSNAIGVYRKQPWARPGVALKSGDGTLWKAVEEQGRIVLFGNRSDSARDRAVARRREIEESLMPLETREAQFTALLLQKMPERMAEEYREHLRKAQESLSSLRAELATLPKASVDPVTGKKVCDVARYEFGTDVAVSLA